MKREFLKILNKHKPFDFVLFDHNPERLQVSRKVVRGGVTTPRAHVGVSSGVENRGTEPSLLRITNARIVGPETKRYCDVLLKWLEAEDALTKFGDEGYRQPILVVQWGPPAAGFTLEALLTDVRIRYERISVAGVPLVASVTLSLKEEPTTLKLTNPTSGGRPGRRRHTVTADENLAAIAMAAFGDPNAWRAIAKVNNIDDPAAVGPGDVLYLPAHEELRELAGASS